MIRAADDLSAATRAISDRASDPNLDWKMTPGEMAIILGEIEFAKMRILQRAVEMVAWWKPGDND